MKKSTVSKLFTVVFLATIMVNSAWAQKVMKIATWAPANHTQNKHVFPEWQRQIEAATDGRVSIKLEYGLGHPKSLFDLVEDGAVDAAWSFNGYMPGRFDLTSYAELPLYKNVGAKKVSLALWDTYDQYLKSAGEYDGLFLGGMWVHAPGQVHLREPIKSMSELKGKKIRIGGGVQKAIADTFGVAGVAAPGNKVYEILQQGVADGAFMPWEAHVSLRLREVAPYVIENDMYYGVFSFVISEDFLDSLSAKDRQAIIKLSGRPFSELAAQKWDEGSVMARKQAKSQHIIASPGMKTEFKQATSHLESQWLKRASKKNKNAEKALRAYQDLVN